MIKGKPAGRALCITRSSALPSCYKSLDTVDPVCRADDELNADRHSPMVILAAAGLALAVGACGSSAESSGGVASGGSPLKEAQCMRSHGVSNFPDPSPGGPSVIPNWINPNAPAFLSAQKACAKFLGGGGSPRAASASEKVALLNLARCMRAHGLANFPDPTTSPPPAPPPGSHTGNAVGIGGVYLVFPPQSPALKRAEAKCGFGVP
jgi:hypothetical protein